MRIRRLLAAALLGGAMLFALAQPASADPSVEANKELKECLEKALDGPTSDLTNDGRGLQEVEEHRHCRRRRS